MVVSALCIVMLVAGCTTPAPSLPTPTTSQRNISGQKNTTDPGIVQSQQTQYIPVTSLVPDTTRMQNQTTPLTNASTALPTLRPEIDPYVNSIGFDSYYFSFDIPGCDMKEIFPSFANDPEYGIEQPDPKLSSVSAAEIRAFIRDHTERSSENSPFKGIYSCKGVAMSPNWNFAEISADITPRNARPASYEISLVMRAQGKNITIFTTQEMLIPDQRTAIVRYIPMKTDEIELLDRAEITFTLLPAPVLTTPVPS